MLQMHGVNGRAVLGRMVSNRLGQIGHFHRFLQLQPVVAARIDDGDHTHNAAVPFYPADRERGNGDTPAGDLVDVPADILEPGDAVAEQEAMARLPFGEDLPDRFSGLALKLRTDIGQKWPTWAVWADSG